MVARERQSFGSAQNDTRDLDEAVEVGSSGVLCDGGVDVERESEDGPAFHAGDLRLPPGAHAFQK